MQNYEYLNADNIIKSIKFDVIAVDTRQVIDDAPSIGFKLFPSGLGFQQNVDVVEGDTIDYVLKQTLSKRTIKLTLLWKGENAYFQYKTFLTWLALYNDMNKYHFRFSYVLAGVRRKVELAVTNLDLKGRDGYRVSAELTMQPLSPFYEEEGITIEISQINLGKIYNYSYPYFYGGGAYTAENVINNLYLTSIPIKITLSGQIDNPMVNITEVDEDGKLGEVYGQLKFNDLSLTSNDKLVVDAFSNKIYLETTNPDTGAVTIKDAYDKIDKNFDSFIYANPGKSRISASLDNEHSKCEAYYVQYVL